MRRREALTVGLLLAVALSGCGPKLDQDAWLREAKLGPYRDPSETVESVKARALEEGRVVVWTMSSRLTKTGAAFEEKYGIECDIQAMSTQNLIRKARYDQKAGGYNADVYLFGDAPEVLSTLIPQGAAWPWIPADLSDSIPEELRVGLPAHHISAVGLIYNSDHFRTPPLTSWWDLTTPEWRGRLVMKDLSKAGGSFNLLTAFVQHSDALADDYEARFGKVLELDGTSNAGYEFIKRLLANDPIFTASGSEAADKVGADNVAHPPVGIMTLGKVRYRGERSLNLKWLDSVSPAPGLAYPDPIGIANGARHPWAAKLFIAYALGREGFDPYLEYGTWPARVDLPLHPELPPLAQSRFWLVDPDFNFRERKAVRDFIVTHQ